MERAILFVEDHDDTRELICELLTASGYEVVGVGSAERAIEAMRARKYDLLITDHWLDPGQTGTWLLHQAEREGLLGPAIMCTAERSLAELPPGVSVVKKPVDVDVLLAAIEAACARGTGDARTTDPSAGIANDTSAASAGKGEPAPVELVLYVTRSQCSMRGLRNLRKVLDGFPAARITLGIVDVSSQPLDATDADRVAFTPMLVKRGPGPRERLVGDLSDTQALEDMLERAGLDRASRVA